jgi:hypothetical protein
MQQHWGQHSLLAFREHEINYRHNAPFFGSIEP